ncbi:MAG TPA: carboxypeptidase-like regulatory domain-containing protein, partial [Bacteroidetes bacterium]|nr:carboxypeptidase-like regulatory domain-containing protein [Bacteroidota bacterium]
MKTKLFLFSVFSIFLLSGFLNNSTSTTLEGIVVDKDGNLPLGFAYIKLFKEGNLITGTQTDIDGKYLFSNIQSGVYDIEASYIGYKSKNISGFVIKENKKNVLNLTLSPANVILEDIVVTAYKAPLIDIDNATTGGIVTSEKISNLSTKSVDAIAATTAVASANKKYKRRRTTSTAILVDGIRVGNERSYIKPEYDIETQPYTKPNTESYELPKENTFISV